MKKLYKFSLFFISLITLLGNTPVMATKLLTEIEIVNETMDVSEIIEIAEKNSILLEFTDEFNKCDLVTLVNQLHNIPDSTNLNYTYENYSSNSNTDGIVTFKPDGKEYMKEHVGLSYGSGEVGLYITVRFKTYEEMSGYKSISSIERVNSSLTTSGITGASWKQDPYKPHTVGGTQSYNVNVSGGYTTIYQGVSGTKRLSFTLTIKSNQGSYV